MIKYLWTHKQKRLAIALLTTRSEFTMRDLTDRIDQVAKELFNPSGREGGKGTMGQFRAVLGKELNWSQEYIDSQTVTQAVKAVEEYSKVYNPKEKSLNEKAADMISNLYAKKKKRA